MTPPRNIEEILADIQKQLNEIRVFNECTKSKEQAWAFLEEKFLEMDILNNELDLFEVFDKWARERYEKRKEHLAFLADDIRKIIPSIE